MDNAPRTAAPHAAPISTRTQILATIIGNALEWYDFTIYGVFAVTISHLFFPAGSDLIALLSTLAIFGVAYVIRPIGGLVFAHFADTKGRRGVICVIIGSMTLGVALIAFAPTYATVGIAAPIILLVARMIQGFSVGGEFSTATTFLVEHAPPGRRFLYGSWQIAGAGAAIMLGGIIGSLVSRGLSPEALETWGWRVPFIFGLVIGPVGFYLRMHLAETPQFLVDRGRARAKRSIPVVGAFVGYKARMLSGLCLALGSAATGYVLFLVMPTYAIQTLHLGVQASFVAPLVGGTFMMIGAPIGGLLADRYGPRPLMIVPLGFMIIFILPAFSWLASDPSVWRMAVVELILSSPLGLFHGAFCTALAGLFPVGVRATGMTVSSNIAVGLFGGFAPLIVTWLVATTGTPLAPAYYVLVGLVIAFVAALALPKPHAASQFAPA